MHSIERVLKFVGSTFGRFSKFHFSLVIDTPCRCLRGERRLHQGKTMGGSSGVLISIMFMGMLLGRSTLGFAMFFLPSDVGMFKVPKAI